MRQAGNLRVFDLHLAVELDGIAVALRGDDEFVPFARCLVRTGFRHTGSGDCFDEQRVEIERTPDNEVKREFIQDGRSLLVGLTYKF